VGYDVYDTHTITSIEYGDIIIPHHYELRFVLTCNATGSTLPVRISPLDPAAKWGQYRQSQLNNA
jgi:hypothetical protein